QDQDGLLTSPTAEADAGTSASAAIASTSEVPRRAIDRDPTRVAAPKATRAGGLQAVRAADHVEHDLVRARADPVEAHVAPRALDSVLLHVSGAAVDLDALVAHLAGNARGMQLGHRDLAHRVLAVREAPSR